MIDDVSSWIVDTDALRWFQRVADGTTLTEVADLEMISQPGVSRALARLEAEVGTPLLRRSGRTLKMTRAGATFKRHVDKLLHDLDDGLAALSQLTDPDTGTVSIAFQASLGTWLVPELISSFRTDHAGVSFDLHEQPDALDAPPLAGGEADVGLSTVRASGDTVRWRPLLAEPLCLAVPAGHALAEHPSLDLSAARTVPFVTVRRGFALRQQTEALCAAAGFDPLVAFEGDDLATLTGFVAAGLGVAVVPRPARGEPAGVRHVPLDDRGAVREIGLVWSRDRRLLPAAEAFRRHVLDHAPRAAAHRG